MAAVSVIIPTFNRAAKVIRAVSSVLDQRFADHEIIVVDDGSTDETEKLLHPFEGRIRLVVHKVNQGVSAARNTGIGLSTAPLISLFSIQMTIGSPKNWVYKRRFLIKTPMPSSARQRRHGSETGNASIREKGI